MLPWCRTGLADWWEKGRGVCVSLWQTECHARCRHVHDSMQVLFVTGLKHLFFPLLASINSRRRIRGGAGNGETPSSGKIFPHP